MTTLAFRNGVLAADRRSISSGWIKGVAVTKIFKAEDGRLIGLCGEYAAVYPFAQWLLLTNRSQGDKPKIGKDEGMVIEICPDGMIFVHTDTGYHPAEGSEFFAWGSGFPAALAAMIMGADAVRAIEVACMLDNCSGGGIDTLEIGK